MNEEFLVSLLSEKELGDYVEAIQEQEEEAGDNTVKKEEIILYHQSGCGMCATVERMLKLKNVEYTSVTDMAEMSAKGISHTPVLSVDGKLLMGKEIIDWLHSRG